MCKCEISLVVTSLSNKAVVVVKTLPAIKFTLPRRKEIISNGVSAGDALTNSLEGGKSMIWNNLEISTSFKYCPECGKKFKE